MLIVIAVPVAAQQKSKSCFTADERASAEARAKVWAEPDPGYDPVLGYNPATGPRRGSPPVDSNGLALPINCVANRDETPGAGTTPKFHCSVAGVTDEDGDLIRYKVKPHFKGQSKEKRNGEINGEFLSSRFSKALGFFADDEWVVDVTCPDCEKSLTRGFQAGATFSPFQPAAGIEMSLGHGIDVKCNGKDSAGLAATLQKLLASGAPRAQIDAFKLWLAFIDHGDTKTDNHKIACLDSKSNPDGTRTCKPGQAVFYVSDMGSTFGYSSASEKKATLNGWKGKDPIKVSGGSCSSTAKSVGDASISEAGRQLLANGLQKLLDAEKEKGTITGVFRASRNAERDQLPEAWTAEFIRKANTIINARCSN
ncbi:MAG TPA: hypothetical protein VJT71_18155 [Pyrinomonadaceae bacterium]|nr:hypothetical protein [Pyrinomonadaceae bacterium]